jgi:signal transduction histidine kinase/ligand-binding sensor domain-containing protein/DNA-binding response OmpR family regulator
MVNCGWIREWSLLLIFSIAHCAAAQNIQFKNITTESGLTNNTVFSLDQDHEGRIWIATYEGLNYFDGLHVHAIRHSPDQPFNNIPSGKAQEVLIDSLDNIWVLFENQKLIRLRDMHGQCEFYNDLPESVKPSDIILDANGLLQVKADSTCLSYDYSENTFRYCQKSAFIKEEIIAQKIKKELRQIIPEVRISSFYQQKDAEVLWVGTLSRGVFKIINGNFNEAINYQHEQGKATSLAKNEIYCILIDNQRNLWIGTKDGGVNKGSLKPSPFKNPGLESNNYWGSGSIRAILKDDNKQLWIGTYNNGITLLDNEKHYKRILFPDKNSENKWNWIRCIYQSSDGYIWIGSYAGLCRIHPKTLEKKYFKSGSGEGAPREERIYSIIEDSKGNLFIGEWGCIEYFDRKSGSFQRVDTEVPLKDNNIRKLFLSDEGNLWIATETSGVYKTDTASHLILQHYKHIPNQPQSINSNSVFDIFQDSEGVIWIGSFGGLNSINQAGRIDSLHWVNKELPSTLVYKVIGSSHNRLWCSTPEGIVRIDKKDKQIRLYDETDGIKTHDFTEGAGFCDQNGILFFGGVNGISFFHPDSIKTSRQLPGLFVESVSVNGHPTTTTPLSSSLKDSLLRFSYWNNDLAFEIKTVYIDGVEKTKTGWKLSPFERDFHFGKGSVQTAKYFDLPPGRYDLIIKAANPDGIWSDDKKILSLIIDKPFWMEYYFWALVVFFLSFGIAFFFRLRLKTMKQRNQQLEELVARRTQKIEKQKHALSSANQTLEKKTAEVLEQRDQILAQRDHLLEMHKKLEESNNIQQKFFTNISHDIKTPLSLIYGPLSELLQRTDFNDEVRFRLERMKFNADYIIQLLNQLLDKKKMELGGMQPTLTHGDLIETCKSVVYSFSDQARMNNIDLSFVSSNKELNIRYDHEKLRQIVFNLMGNAIKFTFFGGRIECKISSRLPVVKIEIVDTGIGIPRERIRYIFDRYYQVGKASNKNIQGSGIGLSLVKEFVTFLNGTIDVESNENLGSKFLITLPVENTSATNAPITKNEETDIIEAPTGSSKKKETILLAEDNSELRKYLETLLKQHYNVVSVANGGEALEYLKKHHSVSLVLSDWEMPVIDGIELCKRIKQKSRFGTLPFILLTALTDLNNQKEGYFAGIDEFISKPFEPELLLLKISTLLRRKDQIKTAAIIDKTLEPENKPEQSFDDKLIPRIMDIVEKEMGNTAFSQSDLATRLGMSQMKLYRKLKELVQMSPNEFIRTIRIKRATQLLGNKGLTINEISYLVGFNDPKYFSRCFAKETGVSPSAYRKQEILA